jgi:hypothetical protein
MKAGTAQIEITPPPGLELAGFAKRPQPSTASLDPLFVRALYLEDGGQRLLWVHSDVLGVTEALVTRLRRVLGAELAIPHSNILVSATHTHSAPATIQLTGCGRVEPAFVTEFESRGRRAAHLAVKDSEACRLVSAEGVCDLGVDRRHFASAHTDPRVTALGWLRKDGSFKTAFLNYAMHPVCLRADAMSADWPGAAAGALSEALPGKPTVLVSSGACGNINPPAVGVTHAQVSDWGRQIAESVSNKLLAAPSLRGGSNGTGLRVIVSRGPIPIEDWNAGQVEDYAKACLADPVGCGEFGDTFRLAVTTWRSSMLDRLRCHEPAKVQAELGLISLGQTSILTVNGEIFSRFNALVASAARGPVCTVAYANGMLGYIPSAEAYDEGGYEVAWAMLFYNLPRLRKGGLELLAERARRLLAGSAGEQGKGGR